MELSEKENKDLCETCTHYWIDFPMPLERVISHCEIADSKRIIYMNDVITYPCVQCPFNCYSKKN